jgi:hypothetical protein
MTDRQTQTAAGDFAIIQNYISILPTMAAQERVSAALARIRTVLEASTDRQAETAALDLWEIGRRHAKDAMAAIAEHQMKTWDKYPPMSGPTMFIAEAIVNALKECGVAGHD